MLVAFGVTFVLKIMLQYAHVNLSKYQRHFCGEEAILNNTPEIITLLASKGLELAQKAVLDSLNVPGVFIQNPTLNAIANNISQNSTERILLSSELYTLRRWDWDWKEISIPRFCKVLKIRHSNIKITQTQLELTLRSKDLAQVFLDHDPTLEVTEQFLLINISHESSRSGLFQRVLTRCPSIELDNSVLQESTTYEEAVQLLFTHITITETSVLTAVSAPTVTKDIICSMFEKAPDLKISESIFLRAAMMKCLVNYRIARLMVDQKREVELNDEIMEMAVRWLDLHTVVLFVSLLPGFEISRSIVQVTRGNWGRCTHVLQLFRRFNVKITDPSRDAVVEFFGKDFIWS